MDLNLLVGLDALLEHQSVQDAAAALHLTPPAVSRILGRVRRATGDAILVRDGHAMIPTPRALEMRDEVRELVRRAESLLSPPQALDLALLNRSFAIRCHDALLATIAPGLIRSVVLTAPQVRIRLIGENPGDDRELARGDIDLQIGGPPPAGSGSTSLEIARDEMVLVLREGSALDTARPALEDIAAAPHVVVSRRGNAHGPVDAILEQHGLHRRVVATVPTVAAALAIVSTGKAITVLPARLSDPLWPALVARPLPFPLPSTPVVLSWHRRNDADPAHRWLRERAAAAIREVLGRG